MKDWPNHQVIKKLFRTAVPNFIFDYTCVPFRLYSVRFLTFKMSGIWVLSRKMSFLPFSSRAGRQQSGLSDSFVGERPKAGSDPAVDEWVLARFYFN